MNRAEDVPSEHENKESQKPASHAEVFLQSAKSVLEGKMSGIVTIESGSLRLFNAERTLIYEGYEPEQECLKGLICRINEKGELEIVAPCFPKFYNVGEKKDNDKKFHDLIKQGDITMHFPEKVDGTNIRFYVNPDSGEFAGATRGMVDGGKDEDDEGFGEAANIHFGREALAIAKKQFPKILDKKLLERFTPVFELIHPRNRIVTNYGERKDLVLLSVFDKKEGARELTRIELEEFSRNHELHLVNTFRVDATNWENALEQLREIWQGTDKEGSVVTIELNNEVVFRIKVKSSEYLQLMRAMKLCTLKRTEELAEEWRTESWNTFKEKLHDLYPALPEEIMMGYEEHFRVYEKYIGEIKQQTQEIMNSYNTFIQENIGKIETQKDFALMIQNRPDKSFFFLLRKFGPDGIMGAYARIIEQLKKQKDLNGFAGPTKQ